MATTEETIRAALPHFACGEVIKGFGRGSKQLGTPTANFGDEIVDQLPVDISTGVYFGWATVLDNEDAHAPPLTVHKMVMSIGWNPFYKNTKKSMEIHVMHRFTHDFYGKTLKVAIVGYLRDERNFDSLDDLKVAIREDIRKAGEELDKPVFAKYKTHEFFINT